jgi:hypothetical protein
LLVASAGGWVALRWLHADRESDKLRADPGSAADWATRCGDPKVALPIAALVAYWQSDSPAEPLTLARDGTIREGKRVVATVSGACVLDPRKDILFSVGADGVVRGPKREVLGTFESRSRVQVEGVTSRPGELLVRTGSEAVGVDDKGGVFLVPDDRPAFGLPAGVEGEVSRARRTALLMLMMVGRI